jgi:predicted nucleic acid-binding Zn ribbon protein
MESKNIHKEMIPIYDEKCLSCHAVYNRVQKFSEWRACIKDEHRVNAVETSCVAYQKKV